MVASHRRARASALALALSLAGFSCARGLQTVDGSPFGVAPVASFQRESPDAAVPYAPYATPDDDAADDVPAIAVSVRADDPGDDVVVPGDDAGDSDGDDAGDEPATGEPLALTPVPGELAITEVMLSPSGPEPGSEWFEIYNLAASPRLLSGLTIEDGYGDTAVIESMPAVVVGPASYALVVRDKRGAERAFIPAPSIAYAYGEGLASGDGLELDDGPAGDLSLWNDSTLLVDVPYGLWDASWVGQSIELATPQSDETDPAQWCVAQSPWGPGSDDGTPNAPNDCGR
jgi:hypothetical protein